MGHAAARNSSLLAAALLAGAWGCRGGSPELEARRRVLEREVAGLRQLAAALERKEPVVPEDEVAIAVDDTLVRDLLAAQLPFEAEVERFHVRLLRADVQFHGSAGVRLHGEVRLRTNPDVAGTLSATGALDQLALDGTSGLLHAKVAIDEITIEKAAGLESWLSQGALDDLAGVLRQRLVAMLPGLAIPVRVQQRLELPALTTGPVRTRGAVLPIQASVSRVVAGRGRLWVGVRVVPGEIVVTPPLHAPPPRAAPSEAPRR